jgi:hypothetical protein
MNGSVSIFLKQEIGQTKVTQNIFQNGDLTHSLKNQCLIAVLHLYSIETAYEPSLTHIINQTIIKLNIRI